MRAAATWGGAADERACKCSAPWPSPYSQARPPACSGGAWQPCCCFWGALRRCWRLPARARTRRRCWSSRRRLRLRRSCYWRAPSPSASYWARASPRLGTPAPARLPRRHPPRPLPAAASARVCACCGCNKRHAAPPQAMLTPCAQRSSVCVGGLQPAVSSVGWRASGCHHVCVGGCSAQARCVNMQLPPCGGGGGRGPPRRRGTARFMIRSSFMVIPAGGRSSALRDLALASAATHPPAAVHPRSRGEEEVRQAFKVHDNLGAPQLGGAKHSVHKHNGHLRRRLVRVRVGAKSQRTTATRAADTHAPLPPSECTQQARSRLTSSIVKPRPRARTTISI